MKIIGFDNLEKIIRLFNSDDIINFYEWECPPRKVEKDGFVNFNLDLEKIMNGKKIDAFTELPKCIDFFDTEKEILNIIFKFKRFNYFKIIADTNGYYLYTKTNDKNKLSSIFLKFKRCLQEFYDKVYGKGLVKIILYTCLQERFKNKYDYIFQKFYLKFPENKTFDKVSDYLKKHVGIEDNVFLKDLTRRTIASYIAEGKVFELLDEEGILKNTIWLNMSEPKFLAQLTDISRKSILPKIYFSPSGNIRR